MNRGNIFTFYSYKGGTGRTMALASVASQLASDHFNKKVLVIDWDLEAPGLHLYLEKWLDRENESSVVDFANTPGLIELFEDIRDRVDALDRIPSEFETIELLRRVDLSKYVTLTKNPNIDLIKAGALNEEFSSKINAFDWEALLKSAPYIYQYFASVVAARDYDYVLIDSRTGITDSTGVCAMLLPEKLVVVFTPNKQSLTGVEKLIRKAVKFRARSNDLRPLSIFPLVSRVEANEFELRNDWRRGNPSKDIEGYQPRFETLFKDIYRLFSCDLETYFDEVLVQQVPNISFGENIVGSDSLLAADKVLFSRYRSLTQALVDLPTPWSLGVSNKLKSPTQSLSPYPGLKPYGSDQDAFYINVYENISEIGNFERNAGKVSVLRGPLGTGKTSLIFTGLRNAINNYAESANIEVDQVFTYIDCEHREFTFEELAKRFGNKYSDVEPQIIVLDHVSQLSTTVISKSIDLLYEYPNNFLFVVDENPQKRFFGNSTLVTKDETILVNYELPATLPASEVVNMIESSARICGVIFESNLVNRVVSDLMSSTDSTILSGHLPLLQLILTTLWENKSSGWVTHRKYTDITRKDKFFEEIVRENATTQYHSLDDTERKTLENIFCQLVTNRTFRSRRITEARSIPLAQLNIDRSQKYLISNLVAKAVLKIERREDDDYLSLAHDVLVAGWGVPQSTIEQTDQDKLFLWKDSTRNSSNLWESQEKDDRYLLRGALLDEAKRYSIEHKNILTLSELDYIDKSSSHLAKLKSVSRQKWGAGFMFLSLAAFLLFTIFSQGKREKVRSAFSLDAGANTLSVAELLSNGEHRKAASQSWKLYERSQTLDLEDGDPALTRIIKDLKQSLILLQSSQNRHTLRSYSSIEKTRFLSEDGKHSIAIVDSFQGLKIADIEPSNDSNIFKLIYETKLTGIGVEDNPCTGVYGKNTRNRITDIFRKDSVTVVFDSVGNISISDKNTDGHFTLDTKCVAAGSIYAIDFYKENSELNNRNLVAVGAEDTNVHILQYASTGVALDRIIKRSFGGAVFSVKFISETHLFVRTESSELFLWDISEDKIIKFKTLNDIIISTSVSNNNKLIIAYSSGQVQFGTIPVDNWSTAELNTLRAGSEYGYLVAANFSSDGNFIVSYTKSGDVNVWDTETRDLITSFKLDNVTITTGATSANGKMLLSAGSGRMEESNVDDAFDLMNYSSLTSGETRSFESKKISNVVHVDMIGNRMAITSNNVPGSNVGTNVIWDMQAEQEPYLVLSQVFSASFITEQWILIQNRRYISAMNLEIDITKNQIINNACRLLNVQSAACR